MRAKFDNYTEGDYFITICTEEKEHYFGEIREGEMRLTRIGEYTRRTLEELETHYDYVRVEIFVVMPNHIHAILRLRESPTAPCQRLALGVVIGGLKQSVTRFARRNCIAFEWQKRFHDHVIRGAHDGDNIARYIENNVANWNVDRFNPFAVGHYNPEG
jgi:REP element-mobilizing transposase RayT